MYQQHFQGRPAGGPRGPRFGGRPFDFDFGNCHPGGRQAGRRPVPVNIETTPDSFVLTLFAAGLSKEKIQLSVQGEVLTVAYPGTAPAADPRYTHREFHDLAFERTFQLNGKVLVENIRAGYADGILTVTLPKDPAANPPAQTIAVG